ncbi:hypothetical protein ACFFIF_00240 [Vagococcus entomophilus]|uniref:Uncharacterized protein n=1 Tax=Vagococcus entomophilus TaxID=1160095 RepID=A0A430AKW9_9ENTE|nr:hypothetical protein [Vagococcus entomophilus]RSU08738.1 hypothetical protein CBF30_05810 [Vagococcus entomophilus]
MLEIISVCIGALIVFISMSVNQSYHNKKYQRYIELQEKKKEMETLMLLNRKINEITQKRSLYMEEYVSFDSFDDCYITIDDYVYLQSFCAQNYFYLPNYLVEEFFKNIAHRQVILAPEETHEMGGFAYKGGRLVLENFSEELIHCAEDRKTEISKLSQHKIPYFDWK